MNDGQRGVHDGEGRRTGVGPPPGLAERLELLRSLQSTRHLSPTARPRDDAAPRVSKRALSILVAARLGELRSLDELARYLHRNLGASPVAGGWTRRAPNGSSS